VTELEVAAGYDVSQSEQRGVDVGRTLLSDPVTTAGDDQRAA